MIGIRPCADSSVCRYCLLIKELMGSMPVNDKSMQNAQWLVNSFDSNCKYSSKMEMCAASYHLNGRRLKYQEPNQMANNHPKTMSFAQFLFIPLP